MLSFHQLGLRRGTKKLFENVSITINTGYRVGLIGENGSGKSSLFAMILKQLEPSEGEIKITGTIQIASLSQETPASELSALEYVIDGDTNLRKLQSQMVDAEHNHNAELISTLHARFAEIDGYSAPARAASLMHGLGFSSEVQQQAVKDFSGGWRVRLNLAQTLMMPSELLLLDEPTNHLDLDAIIWLEKWLSRYKGTLLVISHDREFLDNCVSHILHLEQQNMQLYTGNYSAFEKIRAANLERNQQLYEKQQQHINHLMSFVNRFKAKASKAKQAQSRVKAIERLEIISSAHIDSPFSFEFKPAPNCASPMLQLEKVCLGYNDKAIINNLNFSIHAGARIGLLGPNGAGKSTFIKCLAGELTPLAGKITTATKNLKISYFAQHQLEQLDLAASAATHIQRISKEASEQQIRNFLGGFAFHGTMATKPITNFSGGEKARLVLAILVWQQPNLLLLDEPTNHLDLDMRSALEMALQSYQGALVVISHDRYLLRSTVDQFYLIADYKVVEFAGDLEDYVTWINKYSATKNDNAKNEIESKSRQLQRKQIKSYENKLKKLETEINKLQQQYQEIENILSHDHLYAPSQAEILQKHLQQQQALQNKIQTLENDWLDVMHEIEKL